MPTRTFKSLKIYRRKSKTEIESCQNIKKDVGVKIKSQKSKIRVSSLLQDGLKYISDDINIRTRHCFIPSLNQTQEPLTNFSQLNQSLSCYIEPPKSLYVAKNHAEAYDICFHRTRMYEYYKCRLNGIRTRYLNYLKHDKDILELEKKNIYHNIVFSFAKRFHSDPDPFFRGSYDYYYSGGNLCNLSLTNEILHVDGINLRDLIISTYQNNRFKKVLSSKNYAENSEIFELQEFPHATDYYRFITRQKKEINIESIIWPENNEDKIQIDTIIQFKAKIPFISFSHVPKSQQQILVSNMKQQIRLYDFGQSETIQKQLYKLGLQPNNLDQTVSWNAIKPLNENTFCYINDKDIQIIDIRTTQDQWLKSNTVNPSNYYVCNQNSALAISAYKPLIYVGTAHHLHGLDTRQLRNDSGIFTCTHQMQYPPIFIDTFRNKKTELIALSSARAGEIRICELHRTSKKSKTYEAGTLAYEPTTLMESYDQAKRRGYCLQVGADLKNRLNVCITGLSFSQNLIKKEKDEDRDNEEGEELCSLLFSNSNGDVYAHKIYKYKQENEMNSNNDISMNSLAEKICRLAPPILQCTEIMDAEGK